MRTTATIFALAFLAGPALAQSEIEPNDTFGEATEVSGLGSITGELSTVGDIDFFVFTDLGPGKSYFVELRESSFNLGLGRFDTQGNLLDSVAFEFPLVISPIAPLASGEILVAVCGVDAQNMFECDNPVAGDDSYLLVLPEPGGASLGLAVTLSLALLARFRRDTRRSSR